MFTRSQPRLQVSSLMMGLWLSLFGLALMAQQEQLVLNPPLRESFPMEAKTDGVRLAYPVLVNDHTILRPNAVLRFIYIDPNAGTRRSGGGGGEGGIRDQSGPHGTITQDPSTGGTRHGESSGGWGSNAGDEDAGIFDENKKDDAKTNRKELQTEVWLQTDLFSEALDHATDSGTTLVYSVPPQNRPQTAVFDLPEGMLLAEVNGHVRVLALTQDSRAFVGGIRAGDEIRSFNRQEPVNTLGDFTRSYSSTKRQARVAGITSYTMEIARPGEDQIVSIQIAAPPTIPSFF